MPPISSYSQMIIFPGVFFAIKIVPDSKRRVVGNHTALFAARKNTTICSIEPSDITHKLFIDIFLVEPSETPELTLLIE